MFKLNGFAGKIFTHDWIFFYNGARLFRTKTHYIFFYKLFGAETTEH